MDAAMGFLMSLIFLSGFGFMLAVLYKNRAQVSKWLNTPYYAEDDREIKLKRSIEDSQAELKAIEERKAKAKPETGG